MGKSATINGGICLYGNSSSIGWLAHVGPLEDGKMLGDGEPKPDIGATVALFDACAALSSAGVTGDVEVHAPGGKLVAVCSVSSPPWYGSLKWKPAEVYVVSAEAIVAAAEAS